MLDILKDLCLIDGISGREDSVRKYIIEKISDKCEYRVDPMGNVIAFKKGKRRPCNKVMLSAHMDEVGFIVTYICDNGYIKFANVGGVDSRVVSGRSVSVGENGIPGIVGNKALHLTDGNEDRTVPPINKMYIDIGAANKSEAEKYVSIGDSVYFKSDFIQFGDNKVKAKGIDDRFGCAVLLKMIEKELEYDTYFAFLVQEEVGCRGAGPVVFSVRPDYAIVLEATTASDVSVVAEQDCVCLHKKGAVVSFMDRSTVYNRQMFRRAFEIAEEKGIKVQTKTTVAGGNDAGAIHKSCDGVYTIAISLPCRYIHSATNVADVDDMKSCYQLAEALCEEYYNA